MKDDRMLKILIPGAVAVVTLVALLATIAYAKVHEPLLWWVVIGEAIVLFGMFLRLRYAMQDLRNTDEE